MSGSGENTGNVFTNIATGHKAATCFSATSLASVHYRTANEVPNPTRERAARLAGEHGTQALPSM